MNHYTTILFRYTSLFLLFMLFFYSMHQVWILHIIRLANGTQLPCYRPRAPPIPMLFINHDGMRLPLEWQRVGGRWYHPIRQLLPRRGAPTASSSQVGSELSLAQYGGQPPRPSQPNGCIHINEHSSRSDWLLEMYWWWYKHHPPGHEMKWRSGGNVSLSALSTNSYVGFGLDHRHIGPKPWPWPPSNHW